MRNAIQQRIARVFWDDGLLDLLAGFGAVLIGVGWLLDMVPLAAVAPAILTPLWKPLRVALTEPRLGLVEFSAAENRRYARRLTQAVVLGVVVLGLGVSLYIAARWRQHPELMHRVSPALPCLILALLCWLAASATSLVRFVWYGLAFAAAGALAAACRLEPGWGILAGGLVMSVAGTLVLAQFLARHPVVDDGVES